MFSDFLKNKFDSIADADNCLSKIKVEELIRKGMGYAFNRKSLDALAEYGTLTSENVIKVSESRTKYTYNAIIDILVYLIVVENVPGFSRGSNYITLDAGDNLEGVKASVLKLGRETGTNTSYNLHEAAFESYSSDKNRDQSFWILGGKKMAPDFFAEGAEPHRAAIMASFLYRWLLCGYEGDFAEKWDFYFDWGYFSRYIIKGGTFQLINQHKQRRWWCGYQLQNISPLHKTYRGATLASSIDTLDKFIRNSKSEAVSILQSWMEIILFFETGTGWVVEEAKVGLNKGLKAINAPLLDATLLIDDWWLLSYIYLQTLEQKYENDYENSDVLGKLHMLHII